MKVYLTLIKFEAIHKVWRPYYKVLSDKDLSRTNQKICVLEFDERFMHQKLFHDTNVTDNLTKVIEDITI